MKRSQKPPSEPTQQMLLLVHHTRKDTHSFRVQYNCHRGQRKDSLSSRALKSLFILGILSDEAKLSLDFVQDFKQRTTAVFDSYLYFLIL